jgi:hypothetical protein
MGVAVSNGREVPGEWDRARPIELPAVTLRRAISRVEALLQRHDRATGTDDRTNAPAVSLATVTPISAAARCANQAETMRAALDADNEAQQERRLQAAASRLIADARNEAAAIIDAARREAQQIRQAALAERENSGLSNT